MALWEQDNTSSYGDSFSQGASTSEHSSELERILQDTVRVMGINLVKALAIGLKNVNNIKHNFNTE